MVSGGLQTNLYKPYISMLSKIKKYFIHQNIHQFFKMTPIF